jgi:tyrosinase
MLMTFFSRSLYVQGLAAMQGVPESELLSYYQIAGIHGRPYYSWDDVPQTPGAPLTGYCPHSESLTLFYETFGG